jgi:hypothetical protein
LAVDDGVTDELNDGDGVLVPERDATADPVMAAEDEADGVSDTLPVAVAVAVPDTVCPTDTDAEAVNVPDAVIVSEPDDEPEFETLPVMEGVYERVALPVAVADADGDSEGDPEKPFDCVPELVKDAEPESESEPDGVAVDEIVAVMGVGGAIEKVADAEAELVGDAGLDATVPEADGDAADGVLGADLVTDDVDDDDGERVRTAEAVWDAEPERELAADLVRDPTPDAE